MEDFIEATHFHESLKLQCSFFGKQQLISNSQEEADQHASTNYTLWSTEIAPQHRNNNPKNDVKV